jgi:hypothetical protein
MSSVLVQPSFFHSTINTVEDALRISMPSKKGQNNALLFKLARAILTLTRKGQHFEQAELDAIFDSWYKRAHEFLREGQTKEAYYLEFLNACQRAKYPLGSAKIAEAWENAKSQPLPEEAKKFEDQGLRLLVAFLKQMQIQAGQKPFYITYRDCAALIGHPSHTTVVKWFGALTQLKYIRVAEAGNETRATRYLYIWCKGSA